MSFFGDIKDKFSKDTYEGGYMYEDDGANGQYGYDETPETAAINGLHDDRFRAVTGDVIGDKAMMERLGSGYDIVGGGSSIELKVVKPQLFEDSAQVADHLLSKRTVVLNLEDTNKEAARRILDFLTGVAYSIGGNIKKVANSAYVVTPSNVDVSEGQIKQKAAAAKELIAAAESEKGTAPEVKSIATRNALQIIYYLMAADGTVYHSEEEKFDAIGAALDPNFADSKPAIIKDCQAQLEKVIDLEDYYDVLQDGVEDAIQSSNETADTFITPKLFVWDLLTIAYSDESYDETERKLLKYIVRKLQIDKAVFLEMESSILTILDIEKEIAWIKTTDRPYLTIEARVNELTKRQAAIFDSVKDLITL